MFIVGSLATPSERATLLGIISHSRNKVLKAQLLTKSLTQVDEDNFMSPSPEHLEKEKESEAHVSLSESS